jgi:nucleotide-binding universal stress UspA family protein
LKRGTNMTEWKVKSILIPTDFSELAGLALEYAVALGRCFSSKLTLLYADPFLPPPHFTMGQMEDIASSLERSKAAARAMLQEYASSHIPVELSREVIVREGLAVNSIIEVAEELEADLIVMGTHGRSGVSRFMLGSVTERVLRETSGPVLSVRGRSRVSDGAFLPVKHVVCPVNYTETSKKALRYAAQLAQCFQAELSVLHVMEPADASSRENKAAMEKLCNWIPEEVRQHCQLQEALSEGEAAEQILNSAHQNNCDLIVLGSQHKKFFDSAVIGTTTVRVTRHAPCPVLTVVNQ